MKQLKILLLSLSVSITLLLTFIISYLEPYELLFREYIYLIVVLQCLVLFSICLITLLIIHGIKYYNNKNNTFNLKDVEPRNNKTKSKEYIFNDKQHLFSFEFVLIPGDIVDLNRSLYKTELFNNKTQYSKADILGSKYVFIWQSNK